MDKKYFAVFIITAFVIAVGGVLIVNALTIEGTPQEFKELNESAEPNLGGAMFTTEARYLGNNSATTTKVYLETGGASSTLNFNCDETESIDMNLMFVASSTASKLQWTYEFSFDNVDWFFEDGKTVNSDVQTTHGAGGMVHFWTPGTTSRSQKNVTITPVASQYCRVVYGVTGGNGSLWSAMILKKAY